MGRIAQDLKNIKVTVGSNTTITKGQFYLLQEWLGMAAVDASTVAGVTGSVTLLIDTQVAFETDQMTSGEAATKGQEIHWNTSTSKFTDDADNGQYAGKVVVAQDSSDVAWIKLADQHVASYERQEELFDYLRDRIEQGGMCIGAGSASVWFSEKAAATAGVWIFKTQVTNCVAVVNYGGSTPVHDHISAQANLVLGTGGSSTNVLDRYTIDTVKYTVICIGSATALRMSSVAGAAGSTATATLPTAASIVESGF